MMQWMQHHYINGNINIMTKKLHFQTMKCSSVCSLALWIQTQIEAAIRPNYFIELQCS